MQTIQLQTLEIVQCLFEEDLGCIEVDGVKDGMIQLYTPLCDYHNLPMGLCFELGQPSVRLLLHHIL